MNEIATPLEGPLGILGGTFDPIHYGHLNLALAIVTKTPITRVAFMPCYQPVHRSATMASPSQRAEMLTIALKPYPYFFVDYHELDRKEPSYMYDTLLLLKKTYPNTPLCLILGSDAYNQLPLWKNWKSLLDMAHIIVIHRPDDVFKKHPDVSLAKHESTEFQKLVSAPNGCVYFLDTPPDTRSATKIRHLIKKGEDISAYVPSEVAHYIAEQNLYR